MANYVADALDSLKQAESELLDQLRQVQGAIVALEQPRTSVAASTPSPPSRRPLSVAKRVVALLDEADRAWTAKEIADEWERRGNPIKRQGGDPTAPIRTALHNAVKQAQALKLGDGRYCSVKFQRGRGPQQPGMESLAPTSRLRPNSDTPFVQAGEAATG